jgi:hypothetical protein
MPRDLDRMTAIRTEAEALARALELGAVAVADAVRWADGVIEVEDHPHASVCEVAMASRKYPPDVVALLRETEGDFDEAVVRKRVLRLIDQGLREDASRADHLARALYELAAADQIEDNELRRIAWWAWDALDLADSRAIVETRDEVVDKMQRALHRVAAASAD